MLLTTAPKVTVALAADLHYCNLKLTSAITGNFVLETDVAEILEKVPLRCKHFICTIDSLYCHLVILGSQVACQKESMLDDKNSVGLLCQPV